ncbi:hypothetical protein L6260_00985, partial [Candidatus Parcubacteria bacterium]|nr:hypothetical protein [Candidatus Parcubacteria bacterium]
STLVQMEHTESMTSKGYLPLGDKKTLELYIFNSFSQSLQATGYTLPFAMRCYGCATSLSSGAYPMAEILDNGSIVVQKDDDWFLFDPLTFTAKQILMPNVGDSMILFVGSDNQLHVYTGVASSDNGLYTEWSVFYIVSAKNTPLEVDYDSKVIGQNIYNSFINDPHDPHATFEDSTKNDSFPFMDVYGQVNEYSIGTIGAGVYVADEYSLSKIGFTSSSYTDRPILINDSQVVWIGQDDNLYIADVDYGVLASTGVQDVPGGNLPFRTMSDSTVYFVKFYQTLNRFDCAQDYYDYTFLTYGQVDISFSRVVFISDDAFKAKYGDKVKDSIASWKLDE